MITFQKKCLQCHPLNYINKSLLQLENLKQTIGLEQYIQQIEESGNMIKDLKYTLRRLERMQ